jgi:hypothetical protein
MWRLYVKLLIIYIPFSGVVQTLLYPSPLPILFKDIFFIIPAYLGFYLSVIIGTTKNKTNKSNILFVLFFILLASLVFVQSFNPSVPNWLVAAIGAKVWLFYLPMLFLGFHFIRNQTDLIKLLRIMVLLIWIPCTIGILEYFASVFFGYQYIMTMLYGDAARSVSQNFANFEFAGGYLYRIPSTFSFSAQYFGYLLAMIVPAYMLMKIDPIDTWRRIATYSLFTLIIASFISGTRAAFLFIPLILIFTYIFEGKIIGIIKGFFLLLFLFMVAMFISGINIIELFDTMLYLFLHYSEEYAYQGFVDSISRSPLGLGTGMNTGAARYAFATNTFQAFESYYAKIIFELGILGFFIVFGLFVTIIIYGYRINQMLKNTNLRPCSAVILAFIITIVLNSLKGWQIDLDPINIYFWFFTGILLKLRYLFAEFAMAANSSLKNRMSLKYEQNTHQLIMVIYIRLRTGLLK